MRCKWKKKKKRLTYLTKSIRRLARFEGAVEGDDCWNDAGAILAPGSEARGSEEGKCEVQGVLTPADEVEEGYGCCPARS